MHTSSVVSGDTNLWYDRLGRISRSRQCADANCAEIGFDFDEAGRLSTLTYPDASGVLSDDSERLSHHYDSAGRLNSLTGHDPTATSTDTRYANDLSYTALGQLTRLEHSNGVIDTRLDHESGLIYLSARYYDPTLGRFTSADSIIPDPHNPQTLDPYAYVMNDPANYTDPSGHMPMRIELRKEQAADTTFAWMYFRSLQAQCSWWGQCPIAAGPAGWIYKHTPGRATSKSTPQGSPGSSSPASGGAKTSGRGLSPSKSAPRPGKSAPDSARLTQEAIPRRQQIPSGDTPTMGPTTLD